MNRYLLHVFGAFIAAFGVLAGALLYWQVLSAPDILARTDNPRPYELKARENRGRIRDRNGTVLVESLPIGDQLQRRYYFPSLVHLTGYDSARYGSSGIEESHDDELTGSAGKSILTAWWQRTVNAYPATRDVTTTIDLDVQMAADSELGTSNGAVVLLQAKTGAIVALAAHPFFDPMELEQRWDELRTDSERPFLNRATQGLYAPGSVFTLVTLAASLESGVVDPRAVFRDLPTELRIGSTVITTTEAAHPGGIDLPAAVRSSHSIVFGRLGLALGWERLHDAIRSLVPALPAGLDVDFEAPGLPPPALLTDADLAATAIGQGRLSVTPLQMALAAATVLGDGSRPSVHLTDAPADSSAPNSVLPREVPAQIRQMLQRTDAGGLVVVGQTGTTRLGPGVEPHSWYLGAAPADDPVWVVCVLIENGGQDLPRVEKIGHRVLASAASR